MRVLWLFLVLLVCSLAGCGKSGRSVWTTWNGHIENTPSVPASLPMSYKFILVFERFEDGNIEGTMTWPNVVLGGGFAIGTPRSATIKRHVRGTYRDRLLLIDDDGDTKDVEIVGDHMIGTDKGGKWKFEATADTSSSRLDESHALGEIRPGSVTPLLVPSLLLCALAFASWRLGAATDRVQWRGTMALAALALGISIACFGLLFMRNATRDVAKRWRGTIVGGPDERRSAAAPLCRNFVIVFDTFKDGELTGHMDWPGCAAASTAVSGRYDEVLRIDTGDGGSVVVDGAYLSGVTPQGWKLIGGAEPGATAIREERSQAGASGASLRRKNPVAVALAMLSAAAAIASIAGLLRARRWFQDGGIASWSDGTVAQGRITAQDGELFEAKGLPEGPVLFRATARMDQAYRAPLREVEEALPGAWFEVRQLYARRLLGGRIAAIAAIVVAVAAAFRV